MRITTWILALALSATACSKHKATCETYSEWAMRCDKDTTLDGDEKDQAKTMITGMCLAAFEGEYAGATGDSRKMMEEMYAGIKTSATCVEKATSCDDYAKCKDKGSK